MEYDYSASLSEQARLGISTRTRRRGITQVYVPMQYEDGDTIEVFIDDRHQDDAGTIRVTDLGKTLMRLSYTFEIDSDNKRLILQQIIAENGVDIEDGEMFTVADRKEAYAAVMQLAQTSSKVASMRYYKREIQQSSFYDEIRSFVYQELLAFNPIHPYTPISGRDELEVDYKLSWNNRDLFLFGVNNSSKARLTAITLLECQRNDLVFASCVVHEDWDALAKKDRAVLTNVADRQFTSVGRFISDAVPYINRYLSIPGSNGQVGNIHAQVLGSN